jgi:hypothetical protein
MKMSLQCRWQCRKKRRVLGKKFVQCQLYHQEFPQELLGLLFKNQFIFHREHAVSSIIMMREVVSVYCDNPTKYLNGVDKVRGCFNGHLLGTVLCRVDSRING